MKVPLVVIDGLRWKSGSIPLTFDESTMSMYLNVIIGLNENTTMSVIFTSLTKGNTLKIYLFIWDKIHFEFTLTLGLVCLVRFSNAVATNLVHINQSHQIWHGGLKCSRDREWFLHVNFVMDVQRWESPYLFALTLKLNA